MWSSEAVPSLGRPPSPARRRVVCALGAAVALTACSFSPVYAPGHSGATLPGNVVVTQPSGELGYWITQQLEDRFGPPVDPRYRLSMALSARRERVAVTPAQTTTRYNIVASADYRLEEIESGRTAASGSVDGFTSYSAAGSVVATRAAQGDAFRRVSVIIADKMLLDLFAAPGLAK